MTWQPPANETPPWSSLLVDTTVMVSLASCLQQAVVFDATLAYIIISTANVVAVQIY